MKTALLVALAVIAVAAVAAIAYALLRARRRQKQAAAGPPRVDHALEMQRLFAAGRKLLGAAAPGAASHRDAPRVLLLGAPGSGKSAVVTGAGMKPRFGPVLRPVGDPATCSLWLLDRAVFIEPAGRVVAGEPRGEGQAPDTSAYRAVLQAARKDRPERPLDGVILALSAGDLLDAEAGAQDLRRTAALLRQRLDEAQRELGMEAPVYLVVTQCDRLLGFDRFVDELDPALRASMLGWSNPRPPTADVTSACVGEALDSVREALALEQARRLGSERPFSGDPEAYLLFPEALDALRGPLKACAEELLHAGEGAEPVALRGIYLCGAAGTPAEGAPGARPVVFARELLERKILAETNLARPSAAALRRRRRALLALYAATAAFALVYGGVLAITSSRVARNAASLTPFLNALPAALRQSKQEDVKADPSGRARLDRAAELLEALSAAETDRLRSFAVPGSWLSGIDGRVERAIVRAYDGIVLDAFRAGLETRADSLAEEEPRLPGGPMGAQLLERTPEYLALEAWLREVITFEAHAARFDALVAGPPADTGGDAGDARLQAVADLSGYLALRKLPPARDPGYHRAALLDLPPDLPFAIADHTAPVKAKSDELFGRLFDRISISLNEAKIYADVEALIRGLNELDQGGAEYRTEKLEALHGAILRTEAQLNAPTLSWVGGEQLPKSAAFDRLLEAVQASRLLGQQVYRADKSESNEERLATIRRTLIGAQTSLSGPLFVRKEGTDQLALGPFVAGIKEPTGALLRQRFMAHTDEEDPVPEDLDGARLSWDLEMLKDAAKVLKEYEAYVQADGLKPFPERVRGTVTELGLRNLKDNVLVLVGKAARREVAPPPSESRLIETARADVVSLAQASEPLRDVLAASGRLGLEEVRDRVRALVRGQGARLLGQASRVLATESLYEVKGDTFAWWNGDRPPVFEAFGVSDAARLAEYLIIKRGRAESLTSSLAEPVLGLLESAEVGEERSPDQHVRRWQRIASALRDYESKKPGNSLSNLERFLLTDLPPITFENCLEQLGRASVDVNTIDFFAERRRSIHSKLYERCADLAELEMKEKYPRLRRFFVRALADRFPFAKLEPGVDREDANPDDVRIFIQNVTEFRKRYRGVLDLRSDPQAKAVVRFLDRMEKVREFMEPMWGAGESSLDGRFDVNVAFRVNRAREVAGNQIAEWGLRFADERVTMESPKPTATWRLGDPVRLQLRWAKNSPDIPSVEQDPGVTVKERMVTFEQRGTWALLRMIAVHKSSAEEGESKEDASSNILQMVVFTIPDPAGGWVERVDTPDVGGVARVFVRLGLTGKEKDKLLKYPDFPTTAPMLDLE